MSEAALDPQPSPAAVEGTFYVGEELPCIRASNPCHHWGRGAEWVQKTFQHTKEWMCQPQKEQQLTPHS